MECKDRKGNIVKKDDSQEKVIHYLYNTALGNTALTVLTKKFISDFAERVLNSRLSSLYIPTFVKNNNINMEDYKGYPYASYNDFFIREIREGRRIIDGEPTHFISPADSKLSVYKIDTEGKFHIKNVDYTFHQLVRNKQLAKEFEDGYIMIFRLSVDDYHRYIYVDEGLKSKNIVIKGVYHTVNPIAGEKLPIYQENQREYSLLKSKNFGPILMMEVGATMVGKIVNYHESIRVQRGMEKGRFEFGGSTVILAVTKDMLSIDEDILKNSEDGFETKVQMGEKIGRKTRLS